MSFWKCALSSVLNLKVQKVPNFWCDIPKISSVKIINFFNWNASKCDPLYNATRNKWFKIPMFIGTLCVRIILFKTNEIWHVKQSVLHWCDALKKMSIIIKEKNQSKYFTLSKCFQSINFNPSKKSGPKNITQKNYKLKWQVYNFFWATSTLKLTMSSQKKVFCFPMKKGCWDTLLIVIIWVYSGFQYCCIFSFLVDSVGIFIADLGSGRWDFRGAIVALISFILYFEFYEQILVPPSGLKDGSNNTKKLISNVKWDKHKLEIWSR